MTMFKITIKSSLIIIATGITSVAMAVPINQVSYASLTGTQVITFDDVPGDPTPGTNYDAIFESGNTSFAEHFVGQSNTPDGVFDVLSGTPTGPLALAVGAAGQNLNIFTFTTQVLTGLGPTGFPNTNAIGEGAFALLFDFDQSEFGFQLVGGLSGSAVINFFKRDGSRIDQVTLTSLADDFYGFSRDGGIKDIAGISLYNRDPMGIGFDNLKHDVAGVPGDGNPIPEPSTLALVGLGLAGFRLSQKKKPA